MENCKIEGRYVKFCYKFRGDVRCIKATFYRQIIKNYIRWFGEAFVLIYVADSLKHLAEFLTFGRAFESLREN